MSRASLLMIAVALGLSLVRFAMPTVPHSWFMVFVALAHIFVGMMLLALIQRRGERSIMRALALVIPAGWLWWPLGWACLMVPALIELGMFVAAEG